MVSKSGLSRATQEKKTEKKKSHLREKQFVLHTKETREGQTARQSLNMTSKVEKEKKEKKRVAEASVYKQTIEENSLPGEIVNKCCCCLGIRSTNGIVHNGESRERPAARTSQANPRRDVHKSIRFPSNLRGQKNARGLMTTPAFKNVPPAHSYSTPERQR